MAAAQTSSEGVLYLVPTPIGNLEDMTHRAVRILSEVDTILAEDTRQTGKLLAHYQISRPLRAHHAHNEHASHPRLVAELQAGAKLALVSDAGTPIISDPGFLLVRACQLAGVRVECLPGPSAFVVGMAASGLPADRFTFEGFLPHKKGRQTRLKALAEEPRTMVFYESPYRVLKTLEQFAEHFGPDRPACVARELSKLHEEVRTATIAELIAYFREGTVKGEFVLIVAGAGYQFPAASS